MRTPITVHTEPYDLESAQPSIDAARGSFEAYLAQLPRKSSRSKHGLMGPVGKILTEIKSGRRDAASLKGYAVRVHEATGRSPSPAALAALESGIDILVELLNETPRIFYDRVLDRLDYGLYYHLRKAQIESKETRRQTWINLLREKYGNEATLSDAWGETLVSFDELYLPKIAEGARNKKATSKQRDIAEFWESQGSVFAEEEDE